MLASSALLDMPLTDEQRQKRAKMIKRCAGEMDRLIADLLDVSRIEAGTFAVQHERMSLAPLITDIVERCQAAARDRDVRLGSEVDPETGDIDGDEQRLGQALANLVGNAIKFTPAGGLVTVRAGREDSHVTIAVEDTGCGIPQEHLPMIFERFWQANRVSGGAGLGLAIVKGIVESHDGTITVRSTPGRGTAFHIRLNACR
jgi:signal transduction histidine kinase